MNLLLTPSPSTHRVVVVRGELDRTTVAELREHVAPLLRDPAPVWLDCAGVEFLDCATLGLFVELSQRAAAVGGVLRVARLRPDLQALVRLFGLDHVLGAPGTAPVDRLPDVPGAGARARLEVTA